MDKKDKVLKIISDIKDQAEELLDAEGTELMSEVELVILATELVTGQPVTTIEYSQPIGIVDRTRVTFMIDEELDLQFPLFGDTYYEEEL